MKIHRTGKMRIAERLPHQAGACRDLMGLRQPGAQLRDRRIRAGCDLRVDRTMQVSQPGWHMTALRPRRRLPRPSPPTEDLGHVGDTDPQQFCDPTNRLAIIRGRENPLS